MKEAKSEQRKIMRAERKRLSNHVDYIYEDEDDEDDDDDVSIWSIEQEPPEQEIILDRDEAVTTGLLHELRSLPESKANNLRDRLQHILDEVSRIPRKLSALRKSNIK